jgi:hypothetical protein
LTEDMSPYMGKDVDNGEKVYDALAKEYAEAFSVEHEKKPKDQEILLRFSQEIGDRRIEGHD